MNRINGHCTEHKFLLQLRQGNQSEAVYPLYFFGGICPPDERKEGMPMDFTYTDLIQFCIFIVALVGLCYEIFKGKK